MALLYSSLFARSSTIYIVTSWCRICTHGERCSQRMRHIIIFPTRRVLSTSFFSKLFQPRVHAPAVVVREGCIRSVVNLTSSRVPTFSRSMGTHPIAKTRIKELRKSEKTCIVVAWRAMGNVLWPIHSSQVPSIALMAPCEYSYRLLRPCFMTQLFLDYWATACLTVSRLPLDQCLTWIGKQNRPIPVNTKLISNMRR